MGRHSHSCPSSDELGRSPFHAPLYGGEPGVLDAPDAHNWPGLPILWVDRYLPQRADLHKE